ncbi:Potassium voltage-gated channel subfamily A member 1 [Acropora cervicornis]|uniref:Potassium voltage-gated channel subfamily A member 1 n=1 Tax=Acropora cervicornis TaxID=6130 RepID=A0AAD9VGT9_ACRCE|nr:Potassium voltage-gated channel subfamily A member 1 [Acropora cervicornis]
MTSKDCSSIISPARKPVNDRVRINVSGTMFETLEETLSRFPDTLLGCPNKRLKYFDKKHDEYFFNRNRLAFDAILFFYQSYGRLVRPEIVPENVFFEEVRFFQIHSDLISARDKIVRALTGNDERLPNNFIKRKIWLLFSRPESSHAAKVFAILSVIIILLSVAIPCFESTEQENIITSSSAVFLSLEIACYIWFTVELVVRFCTAPSKLHFFRSTLNIVDIISVLPYYILLTMQGARAPLSVLRGARMLRVLRIFKLSRYSSGMRVLLFTFSTSMKELGMFVIFITVSVVLSASAAFYAERFYSEKSAFTSIPDALWWAVNTITTVGYGDQYPLTDSGKVVGCLSTVFGVLVIALPVFLFVANFKKVMNVSMAIVNAEKERKATS